MADDLIERLRKDANWYRDVKLRREADLLTEAADRIRELEAELNTRADALAGRSDDLSACEFPAGVAFGFHDEPGEHDPCYVVLPGGAMIAFNHDARPGVDIARAKFVRDACNAALRAPRSAPERVEAVARIVDSDVWRRRDSETAIYSLDELEASLAKAAAIDALYAERIAALEARAQAAEGERDEAQATCTAWQGVYESLEAHLLDRINMRDEAQPDAYLRILRSEVARVLPNSKAIVAARWADYARHRDRIAALEALVAKAAEALGAAEELHQKGTLNMSVEAVDRVHALRRSVYHKITERGE